MKTAFFSMMMTAFTLVAIANPIAPKPVKVDLTKSTIVWDASKVTGSHQGTVNLKSADLKFDGAKLVSGQFEIDMTSITVTDLTGKMKDNLTGHLKSDDFFSVEKFNTSKFVITKAKQVKGKEYEVTGDLTIKGITHPVTFTATVTPDVSASAKIKVDRTKYDVKYGSGKFFDNLGDKAIYDDFELTVNLVMSK